MSIHQPSNPYGAPSGAPGAPYASQSGVPPPTTEPMSRVELRMSATKLRDMDVYSRSDPACILYSVLPGNQRLVEVGRTEVIKDNLNPEWVNKIEIDFRFEERQVLQFHVFDWDVKVSDPSQQDKLGHCEVTLAQIMANGGAPLTVTLVGGGGATISILGEELSLSKEVVTANFAASNLDKKDFFGKSDPFLVISRAPLGGSSRFTPVHRTKHILNTLNPVWPPIVIPARTLCGGQPERQLKIECFDWNSSGTHDFIGECYTSLAQLKESNAPNNQYQLINPKKKAKKSSYKDSGKLIIQSFSVHEEPTFLDYIKGGTQLHFTVAVDFTASNGNPQIPASLHYFNPNVENQYATAIRAVGEIIQDYDSDKQFPALGFGARIPPNFEVSHEFFLNGRSDTPFCSGVEGILAAYRHSLGTVQLYGPTNFAPVINHVANFATAHQDGKNYFVLLIITDGIITDLPHTKRALIAASRLPMSVIIIGVGQEDFSTMEHLDSDTGPLTHQGQSAVRDIVQFVELRQFIQQGAIHSGSRAALAAAVLHELPGQLELYMKMIRNQRR